MPIEIVPPLSLSSIVTPAITCRCRCHLSPPPLLIAIALPSCHLLRICRCRPLQLSCYCATFHHLLTCRHPSTCWLAVTLDWLSLYHFLLCHHLSTCRLVITSPLNAPPSSLPWLVVASPCRCHCPSTRQLVVASPLIAPPSHLSCLAVLAPIVVPPPLIVSDGCHITSHCATLLFDLADLCLTPRCRHHHPSQAPSPHRPLRCCYRRPLQLRRKCQIPSRKRLVIIPNTAANNHGDWDATHHNRAALPLLLHHLCRCLCCCCWWRWYCC